MKKRILLFAIALGIAGFVIAQNTIYVPGDYDKIQDAINAASDNDTVLVDTGEYFENINFNGKAITVKSHFDPYSTDSTFIFNTVINGSQPSNPDSASVVFFINGEDNLSVLRGFTITGGSGSPGSGGGKSGGGIFIKGAGPIIEHNRIINNHCEEGGDFVSGGGIFVYNAFGFSTIIRHNVIDSNTCLNTKEGLYGATGGGISAVYAGECIIHDNIISNNDILQDLNDGYAFGGGIECYSTKGIITDNIISHNTAETDIPRYRPYGGGVYSWAMKDGSVISGNLISHNMITGFEPRGGGIGILDNQGKVIFDKNIIKNNCSDYGGGISIRITADVSFTNNLITDNYARSKGGGIYINNPSEKDKEIFPRSILYPIENNMNIKSGKDISIEIMNNTFFKDSSNYAGAVLYFDHESPLIALNNIFYENGSYSTDYDIQLAYSSHAYFYNNLLDTYRITGGNWEGEDNIVCDPEFEDDTCHLSGKSQCINYGLESFELNGTIYYCPDHDMDGHSRPQNEGFDIGADEKIWVGLGGRLEKSGLHTLVYPNPASYNTYIRYSISDIRYSRLTIHDSFGRLIEILVDEAQQPGEHVVRWNAKSLPSGIYIYRLIVGDEVVSGKIIKR